VRILGNEFIKPGEEGFIQLEMESAVVAVRGDHFIIRWPSPGETIGGGEVVDPYPARRHKRFDAVVIEKLEALRHGTPEDVFLQAALALGLADLRSIYQKSRLTVDDAVGAMDQLFANGAMVQLEEGSLDVNSECLVAAQTVLQTLLDKASKELSAYHRNYPLRKGMLKEELKSRLHSTTRPFNALMAFWFSQKNIVDHGMSVSTVEHQVVFSPQQKKQVDSLLETIKRSPFSPPSVKESQAVIGEELLNAVIDQGELVQVSAEVLFRKVDYEFMLRFTQDHLKAHETITVAEFRDGINTSRRYALAFLEHLDSLGVTIRDGDVRRLKPNKK